MTLIQSIVLGFTQGLTEFLPVSSSGHLRLVPFLLGWPEHPLYFDVALHLGTSLAVIIYFRKLWFDFIKSFFIDLNEMIFFYGIKNFATDKLRPQTKTLITIFVVSIPVAIIGYVVEKKFESFLNSPTLIAWSLLIFSAVMFYADKFGAKNSKEKLTFWDSLFISLSQTLALVPGVSRSGATISTGLFRGLSRYSASEFSFLLSTPIILGAGILKADEIFQAGNDLINVMIGILVSFLSGFVAISFMLKFLKTNSLNIFIVYRIIIALVLFFVIGKL